MDLTEALYRIIGFGRAAVISIIPGKLAYFEPENGRDNRWLLVADPALRAKVQKRLSGR